MSWLTINNWAVEIRDGQGQGKSTRVGSSKRSFDASPRWSTPGVVQSFSLRTTPIPRLDADFLEALLIGQGHRWDFEADFYSNHKGLGPDTGYSASSSTSHAKFGSRSMLVSSGGDIDFDLGYTGDYTVHFWRWTSNDGALDHVALVYDSATTTLTKYINASEDTPGGAAITAGVLKLEGKDHTGTNDAAYYDALVAVPAKAPLAVITAAYNGGTGYQWGALPQLFVAGDGMDLGRKMTCEGVAGGGGLIDGVRDSTYQTLVEYGFQLLEVSPL